MRTRIYSRLSIIVILPIIFMLFVSGCSGTKTSNQSSPVAKNTTSPGVATQEAAAPAANTAGTATSTNGQTGQGTVPDAPKLIKTADATIEVGTGGFEKKFEDAKRLADKFSGHVTYSSASRTKGEMISGLVVIRVPAKDFDTAVDAVKALGKVNAMIIKADDVSEEYVDLQSRLKNFEAQEAQLVTIMAKAQTVAETLAVQEQLTSVRGEIEVIKGRMQYLDSRVDFSTININIQEPSAVVPESDQWGFVDALRTSAGAFLWTINAMIIVLGAVLPLAVIVALLIFIRRKLKAAKKDSKKNA